jgi:translation elongation factor EF-1alpha
VVILELEHEIPVETHADCRALGRIVLRAGGESVAVGVITQLL